MIRGGGDNWTYKTYKTAPVKLSPPTNQRPMFYSPDALPVTQPTVSKHWKNSYGSKITVAAMKRWDLRGSVLNDCLST